MRILLGGLVLLLACGDDSASVDSGPDGFDVFDAAPDTSNPDATLVDAGSDVPEPMNARERLGWTGDELVGFRRFPVSYERPDGVGERELELLVWYPAASIPDGSSPVRYSLSQSAIAHQDAAYKVGSYPVIVFSHGHQAVPDASGLIMEHFASHGWVVLSPRHTGNTTVDPERVTSIYYLRPHDLSASLDFAEAHAELGALLGDTHVVMGHSFGGYTAYASAGATYDVESIRTGCESGAITSPICSELDEAALMLFAGGFRDERFDAVVAMAAGDFELFGDGLAAIDVPAFQMVAEGDGHPADSAAEDSYWNALDGTNDLRFDLLLGAHNSFTDVCVMLPTFPRCSEQDAQTEIEIVRVHALAFILDRLFASADGAEVLAGTDERVELDHR